MTASEVSGLLDWFSEWGISYPWGDNPTPYRVWISEIMLQQTVVTAAIDHFKRWMELFPSVDALAAADEQTVLKAWEGLGYYSRARNLRKGAIYLKEYHGSLLPDDYKSLLKIPGVGDYTARAVLSLAFGKAYPVLDANVRRIGQRLWARAEWSGKTEDEELMKALEELIPHDQPGAFNCALMQLGQQVCRVRSPECSLCPLKESCRCRELGLQAEIPAPKKRKVKEKSSNLYLLIRDGRILLTRRASGIGQGLWFIPSLPAEIEEDFLSTLEPLIDHSPEEVLVLEERFHLYTTWKEKLSPRMYRLKSGTRAVSSDLEISKPDFPDLSEHFRAGSAAVAVSGGSADGTSAAGATEGSVVRPGEQDLWEWVPLSALDDYPTPSVYRKILKDIPSLFL